MRILYDMAFRKKSRRPLSKWRNLSIKQHTKKPQKKLPHEAVILITQQKTDEKKLLDG